VPFERPDGFGNRLFLTDQEFRSRQTAAARQEQVDVLDFDLDRPPAEIVALGDVGGVTSPPPHWLERGEPSRQSSLIVDPPDGRMPPMTPEGIARQQMTGGTYTRQTGFASAADLGPYDRCISRGVVGSMMPVVYNNGNQILQAPGYVVLRNEMIHETRVIPLDGRPHLPAAMRSYMGDSRGSWDGDTLVVRTRNLNGRTGMQGNGNLLLSSDAVQLVERWVLAPLRHQFAERGGQPDQEAPVYARPAAREQTGADLDHDAARTAERGALGRGRRAARRRGEASGVTGHAGRL